MLSRYKCNTSPLGGQKSDIPLRQPTDASFVWTSNRMLGTMCSYTPFLCDAGSAACSGGACGRHEWRCAVGSYRWVTSQADVQQFCLDVRRRPQMSVAAEHEAPFQLDSSASLTADVASNMAAWRNRRTPSGPSQALLHHSSLPPHSSALIVLSTMWFNFILTEIFSLEIQTPEEGSIMLHQCLHVCNSPVLHSNVM